MNRIRRIGVLTGGGDAPGLNAVIRAVVRTADRLGGIETLGVLDGFEGLLERRYRKFTSSQGRDLVDKGGTVLGTTNRCNPFAMLPDPPSSSIARVDRSGDVVRHAREAELDALIVIGGDGTLRIARQFAELGMGIVGVRCV